MVTTLHAFTDTRRYRGTEFRERLVLGASADRNDLQKTGRWLACFDPVDLGEWR